MAETCKNCRFYDRNTEEREGNSVGECRRRAPAVFLDPFDREIPTRSAWPEVGSNDWCGEHEGY